MFPHLRLMARLSIGFGTVLLLVGLVGFLALRQMDRLADLNQKMYRHPFTVSNAVLRVDANIVRIHRALKDITLSTTPTDLRHAILVMDALDGEIRSDLALIEERFLGERKMVADAKKAITGWKPIRDEIIARMYENNRWLAAEITKGRGAAHVADITEKMALLNEFAQSKAEAFFRHTRMVRKQAFFFMYLALSITLLSGGICTWIVIRSVTRPAKAIAHAAVALANGDLSRQIPSYHSPDALGQMAESLRQMLTGVIGEGQSIKKGIPILFWTADPLLTITYANPKAITIAKACSLSDTLQIAGHLRVGEAFCDENDSVATIASQCIQTGKSVETEILFALPRKEQTFRMAISPLRDLAGGIMGVMGVGIDITDRKEAEDRLRNSLAEKEILLREVHHRVKNNLQIISSLLYLQQRATNDNRLTTPFQECQGRIEAMALVHETLYRRADLSCVNLGEYTRRLTHSIFQSCLPKEKTIDLSLSCDDILLEMDPAITFGLILNELMTNAMKYAFAKTDQGKIHVTLTRKENSITFTLSDDGCGLPPDLDWRTTKSLGLRIVRRLTKDQLHGTLEILQDSGTRILIRFCPHGQIEEVI